MSVLISKEAVLAAIDMRCDADTLVQLRAYIDALPAVTKPAPDIAARLAEVERATEVANQQLFESRMQTSYIEARAEQAEAALADTKQELEHVLRDRIADADTLRDIAENKARRTAQ